jgi:hypothetical protein
MGGGWLWGGKPGPGWWCGMPSDNTKQAARQIVATKSKTLQYDMPDSWTAFSPNLDRKLPVSKSKPFNTDIWATYGLQFLTPYRLHFWAPVSWTADAI